MSSAGAAGSSATSASWMSSASTGSSASGSAASSGARQEAAGTHGRRVGEAGVGGRLVGLDVGLAKEAGRVGERRGGGTEARGGGLRAHGGLVDVALGGRRGDVEEVDAGEAVHESCGGPHAPAELDGEVGQRAATRGGDDDLPVVATQVHRAAVRRQAARGLDPHVERRDQRCHLVGFAHPPAHLGHDGVDGEGAERAHPVDRAGLELEVALTLAEQGDERVVDDREHHRGEQLAVDRAGVDQLLAHLLGGVAGRGGVVPVVGGQASGAHQGDGEGLAGVGGLGEVELALVQVDGAAALAVEAHGTRLALRGEHLEHPGRGVVLQGADEGLAGIGSGRFARFGGRDFGIHGTPSADPPPG